MSERRPKASSEGRGKPSIPQSVLRVVEISPMWHVGGPEYPETEIEYEELPPNTPPGSALTEPIVVRPSGAHPGKDLQKSV